MVATTSEILNIAKDGWDIFFGFAALLVGLATAFFAGFQYSINNRLKKLQDYVAVSIVPFIAENTPKIQVRNVGRMNLYLHKYEIDGVNESYKEARLIACGESTFFVIPVPPNKVNVEMPVKFYLMDEDDKKYISTGAVIIDARPVSVSVAIPDPNIPSVQAQAIQQFMLQGNIRGWSYKTVEYNWKI